MTTTILFGVPAASLLVWTVLYNGLVARRNGVENAFASLDAQLQKRYDLVPNLVETVKGYATHERGTLEAVTRLRNEAVGASSSDLGKHEAASAAIRQIFALAENYPQLQANTNFLHLQRSLNEIEEQISAARRAFNASVTDYNNAVQTFPSSLVASSMGLQTRAWFEAEDNAQQPISVGGAL